MKRPQFSLRLILLVVALFAAIFAWRSAVNQRYMEDKNGELTGLRMFLRYSEKTESEHPISTAELRKRIEELSK